ncbi:hypothetical protein MGA5115_02059 [Marinomonas gallaica]|uniref:Uncharacterized protein n=1 Tax=Marinomonas gallaica TaxID=1806667 RepID=A0A1C3JS08_9GAMM|nr:hypothetical protein MGA5115_02059 [Marinomonas gallaica]
MNSIIPNITLFWLSLAGTNWQLLAALSRKKPLLKQQ